MRNNTSWLQHIPKHWEIMRLKDVCELNPNPTDENIIGTVSFVPMESLRYDCITPMSIDYNEARGKYTYFCNEDLLIAKVTPCFENGNVAIAKDLMQGVGFGTSEIFVLRNNEKIKNRFLFYVVRTNAFIGQACSTMYGVGGLKRISPLFMRTASIPLPPLSEQEKIARYLDTKVGEVDQMVSLIEKKIERYQLLKKSIINKVVTRGLTPNTPLKDSQISWLGQIPQHWVSIRNKDMMLITDNPVGTRAEEFSLLSLTKRGVIIRDVESGKGKFPKEFDTYQVVQPGDLIFCLFDIDETPRTVGFVNNKGMITGAYTAIKVNPLIACDKYIYYCYLNVDNFKMLRPYYTGLRKTVKGDKFMQLSCPLPPLSEQQQIASYLDQKCAEIDTIIFNCTAQIEKYKTLKRALINEVVTGQRTIE